MTTIIFSLTIFFLIIINNQTTNLILRFKFYTYYVISFLNQRELLYGKYI